MSEPIDMTGVRIDRDYDPVVQACERCQDGAHWECHGCECPCSWPEDFGGYTAAYQAARDAIRPTISAEQREEQWRLRELQDIADAVAAESARGTL